MFLITGFEPFTTGQGLVLTHNPTADIAQALHAPEAGVSGAVLPVSFTRTREVLLSTFAEVQPRAWIGLGFAPHRTTIDVEVVALNIEHARSGDNDGATPSLRPIMPHEPDAYRSQGPVEELCAALDGQGAAAQLSFHAGTFLCNQSFYLGCHAARGEGSMRWATFVHVPPMAAYDAFGASLCAFCQRVQ